LVVATELCTLHFQQRLDADFIISNALFADGTGAALVSAREWATGPRLEMNAFSSVVIPDSEEEMSWKVGSVAFDMRLSAYVPKFVGSAIREIVERLAGEMGITPKEIVHWAIHPGGRAILDRSIEALELPEAALDHSYAILKDYGNMSSATILFVLKRHLETPGAGALFASAFGPGLTVESALMEKC
jgi:predicted naringenin-chalcone synthase